MCTQTFCFCNCVHSNEEVLVQTSHNAISDDHLHDDINDNARKMRIVETCGVLIMEQMKVEIAEERKSNNGFKNFSGIFLQISEVFVSFAS